MAGLKFSGNVVFGIKFIVMAKGDFAVNCKSSDPLYDILEYMQIAIIKNEAAYFVKTNTLVILKTFDHGCNKI